MPEEAELPEAEAIAEDEEEDEEASEEEEEEEEDDEQFASINAILGRSRNHSFEEKVKVFYEHLQRFLTLPCDVTGGEDFRWE